MKHNTLILIAVLLGIFLQAQQLRYVDTEYILSKYPQYEQAKQRLQQQVNAWKAEIVEEQEAIDQLQVSLENEKVILTDDKIAERQSEIDSKKTKLNEKIEQKFGANGESQQMRLNLIKPLQDQIWNAVNTIAQTKKYHMIFDKSNGANLIYADEQYDITEMVIKELGLDKAPNNSAPSNPRNRSSMKDKTDIQKVEKLEEKQDKDRR